jgi:opacity protein-like surface antigen
MGWLRTLAVGGAALAMSGALAQAADMPGYPPPPAYRPILVNVSSGWYLRGDVGAHWGLLTGAELPASFSEPTDNSLDKGMTYGFGVGIKSDWLRTDVTIDFMTPVKYQGTVAATGDTTAKIQAATALFNGYIDLGNWHHIKPYIGAGAGAAYARVSDFASTAGLPFSGASSNQWNFAYAAMAGVAFPILPNAMVDIGYRYLNIGDVKISSDAVGAMTFKNVAAHELRVGLRWSFYESHYLH